jgi:acyl-CoA thioesterase
VYELDEDTALSRADDGTFRGRITGRWNIGPVPNGGYVMAVGMNALEGALPYPDPVIVSASYLRPTIEGEVVVPVEVIKVGRTYATAEARLVQAGEERVRMVATYGTLPAPDGGPSHVTGRPPELPPREACMAERPGGAEPVIAKRLEQAIDPPSLAFMRGERGEPLMQGWLRFADRRPLDWRALAVAADGFPPPIFNVIAPGWTPTLELTVHFRARPVGQWLKCRFVTRYLFGAHLEEDGEIFDERDQLVALSRQLAAIPRSAS